MFIKSNGFSARIMEVRILSLSGDNNSKMSDVAGEASQAASAILNGESYIGSALKVINDEGVAFTKGTLLLTGVFNRDIDYAVNVKQKNGKTVTVDSYYIDGMSAYETLACALIRSFANLKMLDNYVTSEGLGLDAKLTSQRNMIVDRINSIQDRPLMLIDAAEQLMNIQGDYLHTSHVTRELPSLSGYERIGVRSTTLGTTLAESKAAIAARFETFTGVSATEVDDELDKVGMASWYHGDAPAMRLDLLRPLGWTADALTLRMLDTPNLAHHHFNRFMKQFFRGDVNAVRDVAGRSFSEIMRDMGQEVGVKRIATSLADYLTRLGVEKPITITSMVESQSLLTSQVVDVVPTAVTDVGRSYSQFADLLLAFWTDEISLVKSGNNLNNSDIELEFTGEQGHIDDVMAFYRGNAVDNAVLRDVMMHLDTVTALFQHASYDSDIRKKLTNPVYLKDVVSVLQNLGLEWIIPAGGLLWL